MITQSKLMELSAKAQDKFPMSVQQGFILRHTGDRSCVVELTEQRILWMLNQAYELGKKEQK